MGYRVAQGCSVIIGTRHLLAGTEIPSSFPSLGEHLRSGYIVKTDSDEAPPPEPKDYKEPPVVKPESVVTDAGAPAPVQRVTNSAGTIEGGVVPKPAVVVKPEPAPEEKSIGPKAQPIGKWNVDPETLKGKDLAQLNIMVLERDPSVKPFDTTEEAVAQLSLDFKK